MASDGWIPEIVVGVDFGMTWTGMSALSENTVSMLPRSVLGNFGQSSETVGFV